MRQHDYIIIGAGSSGCVLANRLIANKAGTILLLEAGGLDTLSDIHVPGAYQQLLGSEIDWHYTTESEPYLANRRIPLARAKVLGGCSSMNAMIYVEGNQADYDHWHSLGNTGWDSQSLDQSFKQLQHSSFGSVHLSYPAKPHPLSLQFIEAAAELGHARNACFSRDNQLGVGLYQTTIKEGCRHSAVHGFLQHSQTEEALTLETGALVTRILFDNTRAIGVAYIQHGVEKIAYANKEVIICAGAINTPKLLMLSGIGCADTLKKLAIPVVADLPGVGSNLQDHLWVAVSFKSTLPLSDMTSNGCEAGLFTKTLLADSAPDLQIDALLNLQTDHHGKPQPVFSICPITLHPHSRGRVTLASKNANSAPIIQANYLQDEKDILPLLDGIKFAKQCAKSTLFKGMLKEEISLASQLENDNDLIQFIRRSATTLWHPAGTCKMGIDHLSVVSPTLQVYGVQNLRIADASIMPTLTSGNINAVCYVIAEKAATFILNEDLI